MIVGLTGKKGSGKDTAGAYLVSVNGYERFGFADALKESAAALFGVPLETWDVLKNEPRAFITLTEGGDWDGYLKQITVREFLQRYGTEAHRDVFGEDFWTNVVREKIAHARFRPALASVEARIVVTDVRFENEAEVIRAAGGVVIEVVRPGTDSEDTHASEQLPAPDLIVLNDGTIADLGEAIDSTLLDARLMLRPVRV